MDTTIDVRCSSKPSKADAAAKNGEELTSGKAAAKRPRFRQIING